MAGPHRWALVDDRHTVSVMVNEEDHLRLQAILPGLQLDSAWQIADQMDDQFGAHLDYAFDPHYGYLTSSLSNCGTGLRLSVMAHLPGLALSGKAGKRPERRSDARIGGARALRRAQRRGGRRLSDLQRRQSTGKKERQLLTRLAATATLLVTDEEAARELLWRDQRSLVEDKVGQAQARLKGAERLSTQDSMAILSLPAAGRAGGDADRRHQPGLQ